MMNKNVRSTGRSYDKIMKIEQMVVSAPERPASV